MEQQTHDVQDLKLETKSIGKRLRMLRRFKDLTQAEMGRKLNCKQATISAYEDGRIVPSLQVIYKVSTLFNLDLNWLIRGKAETGLVDDKAVREEVKFVAGMPVAAANPANPEEGGEDLAKTQKELIDLQKKYIELLEK